MEVMYEIGNDMLRVVDMLGNQSGECAKQMLTGGLTGDGSRRKESVLGDIRYHTTNTL